MTGDLPEQAPNGPSADRDLAQLPASERVRYRLISAGCRHHANDNIASFIEPRRTRRDPCSMKCSAKLQGVLAKALVIDTANDHNTQDTGQARGQDVHATKSLAGAMSPCRR